MTAARLKAYTLILIATVIWGLAIPVIKYTLGGFDPLTFLVYRFGISTVIAFFVFLFLKPKFPKKLGTWVILIIYGLLASSISLVLLFYGLKNTTVLDSSLITLADPLLISLAGVYFLRERISKREVFGITIAILGTIITIIEPIIQNHNGSLRLSGNFMIITYALIIAFTAVIAKKLLRRGVEPLVMSNLSFVLGFFSLLPFWWGHYSQSLFMVNQSFHLGVFYMAALSGNLAFLLATKAQKTIEIGDQAIFGYMYPIFSTPLAVLWLGEKITPLFVVGAVTIATGVFIAEIKKKRYN